MLFTWLDVAFVAAGLVAVVYGFWRRKAVPASVAGPPGTRGELGLTLLALIPAAVGPNILVVALTPGMPGMPVLSVAVHRNRAPWCQARPASHI